MGPIIAKPSSSSSGEAQLCSWHSAETLVRDLSYLVLACGPPGPTRAFLDPFPVSLVTLSFKVVDFPFDNLSVHSGLNLSDPQHFFAEALLGRVFPLLWPRGHRPRENRTRVLIPPLRVLAVSSGKLLHLSELLYPLLNSNRNAPPSF